MKCDHTFYITTSVTELAQVLSFLIVLLFYLFLLNNQMFPECKFYLMILINKYSNKESASSFRKLILQKCVLYYKTVNQNLLL